MPSGARMISQERARQRREENWSSRHDDGHTNEELARAAAVYALPEKAREDTVFGRPLRMILWPWDIGWWKPGNAPYSHPERTDPIDQRIAELVKAGALIAAEIDRLRRIT